MDDAPSGLLTIGAFSRACLLSVRTLRKHHDAGLLVPAHVDPTTGYRSYHASQLADAGLIRRLRELDVPLAQIRRILDERNPEVTRDVLGAHRRVMRERLERIDAIVATLERDIDRPESRTPVHVRRLAATPTLAIRARIVEAEFASFLGEAYGVLHAEAERLGLVPAGADGALYPGEIADDGPVEIEAFTPVAPPGGVPAQRSAGGISEVTASEVAAADVAVIIHEGSYDTIGDTYQLLGAWVAYRATPSPGASVREHYLVSYDDVDDPSRFRTEIQWPIAVLR